MRSYGQDLPVDVSIKHTQPAASEAVYCLANGEASGEHESRVLSSLNHRRSTL